MTKPFLLLQIRPDTVSDSEYEAFLTYGHLSPRDVRRVRMEAVGVPNDLNLAEYAGVFVGGGPWNVSDDEHTKEDQQRMVEERLRSLLQEIVARDMPYLGMCYGLGILASAVGARVSKEQYGEQAGPVTITITEEGKGDQLLQGLPESFRAFTGHKEACQEVPNGAVLLASSQACPVQMVRIQQNVYATQFHTELDVAGIAHRIEVYKHHGYFAPEDAETLATQCAQETVVEPMNILKQFVERYR